MLKVIQQKKNTALFAKNSPLDCFFTLQTFSGSNPFIVDKNSGINLKVDSSKLAGAQGFEP